MRRYQIVGLALLPFLAAWIVFVCGGPLWACVGFGLLLHAVVLVGVAVNENVRALATKEPSR